MLVAIMRHYGEFNVLPPLTNTRMHFGAAWSM